MIKEYEFVIVGSGVAGSTVAKRLLEKNRAASILILEAGPEVEAKNRRYWWDYVVQANGRERKAYDFTTDQPGEGKSVGENSFLVAGSRVMMYGGSTVHWGGWSLRFKPEDFKLRTNSGDGGDWPISYDDLEKFYCEAERHLAVCGDDNEPWNVGFTSTGNKVRSEPYPLPPFQWTAPDGEMIEAWKKFNVVPGKMPVARYRKCLTTGTCKYCPFGSRFSGQYVMDELKKDTRNINFEVKSGAPATRVLTDDKRRITGVEYLCLETGERETVHAGTVVICSGAYESPKLLMLSRNRYWEDGIGNDYDLLGRNIVTHSILKVRGRLNHNKERWFQEYDFPTLMSRSFDTEEVQRKTNKIFLFKNRGLPNVDLAGLMISGKNRKQIDDILTGSRQQELQAFMEEKSRPENRLTLARGRNRFGLPKMKINFSRPAKTQQNGEEWLNTMEEMVLAMGYSVDKAADPTGRKKPYVNMHIQEPGGHHATGTCRMGESPDEGVVDENLLVFGTKNLYVCSNAVFPSGSAVNPTLTLTALAFRLGDHLS